MVYGRRASNGFAAAALATLWLCSSAAVAQEARLGLPRGGSPLTEAAPRALPPSWMAGVAAKSKSAEPDIGPYPRPLPDAALPSPFSADERERIFPIDLATALRLTGTNNWDIARGREVVTQASIALDRARLLLVPNLNMGSTYTKHDGRIAKTEGNIIKANKDAIFVGGGPSLSVNFADAIFVPLVARQTTAASRAGFGRVQNDTLLLVAESYFAVLRARRKLARVDATLEFLTSESPSPARAGSKGLLPVVDAMQKAGAAEALKAEVYRAQVETIRRQEERRAIVQEFRLAMAELARLLRLPPDAVLWPVDDFRFPLDLPNLYDSPNEDLFQLALSYRPEMAENRALIEAARERVRTAKFRPLLPNFIVNYAWGDFGGGPDPNTVRVNGRDTTVAGFGPSGRVLHMGTRDDLDVSLIWRLQNMGFGNLAEVREQESLFRQANLRLFQIQDQIVTQIVQTKELAQGWGDRVAITRSALFDREGKPKGPVFEALRLNFQRIREVEKTRPLEVLDSIRGLSDLLDAYGQAATDYDRARFRLLIALGLPPEEIVRRVAYPPTSVPPAK
ncbi:MAG: TolC family protein [Gemmataceae bacterium]